MPYSESTILEYENARAKIKIWTESQTPGRSAFGKFSIETLKQGLFGPLFRAETGLVSLKAKDSSPWHEMDPAGAFSFGQYYEIEITEDDDGKRRVAQWKVNANEEGDKVTWTITLRIGYYPAPGLTLISIIDSQTFNETDRLVKKFAVQKVSR